MTNNERKNRLRIVYSKTGLIRFISHLDLLRLFHRAVSRAGTPVEYSQGFNPHPKISFAPPLKVGISGENELLDIQCRAPVDAREEQEKLNRELPGGMKISQASVLPAGSPTLGKIIREAEYSVFLSGQYAVDRDTVADFLSASSVPVTIEKKGKPREIDARRGVMELSLSGSELIMKLSVKTNARPYAVVAGLTGREASAAGKLFWIRRRFLGAGL